MSETKLRLKMNTFRVTYTDQLLQETTGSRKIYYLKHCSGNRNNGYLSFRTQESKNWHPSLLVLWTIIYILSQNPKHCALTYIQLSSKNSIGPTKSTFYIFKVIQLKECSILCLTVATHFQKFCIKSNLLPPANSV